MSVSGESAGAATGQPGYPNLKSGREGWRSGQSGNPDGVSAYQAKLRKAIEAQEAPELVCQVIEAMRQDAMAHEKFSPAAAKVYLSAVGLEMNKTPTKVDLSDAPPEVMQYLAGKIQ